jgi:hypothetical protein
MQKYISLQNKKRNFILINLTKCENITEHKSSYTFYFSLMSVISIPKTEINKLKIQKLVELIG